MKAEITLDAASNPMVFIANYWESSSTMDVTVFSNCEEVELFINDNSQGVRSPETAFQIYDEDSNPLPLFGTNLAHPPFEFNGLSWQSGELRAEGLISSIVVASHTVLTPGSAVSLELVADDLSIGADGSDCTRLVVSVLDAQNGPKGKQSVGAFDNPRFIFYTATSLTYFK